MTTNRFLDEFEEYRKNPQYRDYVHVPICLPYVERIAVSAVPADQLVICRRIWGKIRALRWSVTIGMLISKNSCPEPDGQAVTLGGYDENCI